MEVSLYLPSRWILFYPTFSSAWIFPHFLCERFQKSRYNVRKKITFFVGKKFRRQESRKERRILFFSSMKSLSRYWKEEEVEIQFVVDLHHHHPKIWSPNQQCPLLNKFQQSSEKSALCFFGQIMLVTADRAYNLVLNLEKTYARCVPAELSFCIPPLLVGLLFFCVWENLERAERHK